MQTPSMIHAQCRLEFHSIYAAYVNVASMAKIEIDFHADGCGASWRAAPLSPDHAGICITGNIVAEWQAFECNGRGADPTTNVSNEQAVRHGDMSAAVIIQPAIASSL